MLTRVEELLEDCFSALENFTGIFLYKKVVILHLDTFMKCSSALFIYLYVKN